MSEARKESGWPAVVALVLAVIVAALGAYVGGYYAMGTLWEDVDVNVDPYPNRPLPAYHRIFNQEWQALVFKPAASVESLLTGREVFVELE